MGRFLRIVWLGSLTISQICFAEAKQGQKAAVSAASRPSRASDSVLPAPPPGKSTVIGGAIRDVDPVRDQFTLNVFGGKRMKVIYDARTQVYQDGKKIPLRDLHADNHASVETVLDGTSIYARSVHTLTQSPQGECQGQVLKYDPRTGELTVSAALSNEPIALRVPAGTPIVRAAAAAALGSAGPSDLVKGTLVSVVFESGSKGRGVARQITVLATPGSSFVFTGKISFLDLHAKLLVVTDPRDEKSYKISLDPERFANSQHLHQGDNVKVNVEFDGTRYVATAITVK